eukprot:scaffold81059_cov27-Prasinocladus_malaysianus.AAC.1
MAKTYYLSKCTGGAGAPSRPVISAWIGCEQGMIHTAPIMLVIYATCNCKDSLPQHHSSSVTLVLCCFSTN